MSKQNKIGADILAASQELANAKRISSAGGPLAERIGSGMEAEARRKIKGLVDRLPIAKDERPVSMKEIMEAIKYIPENEAKELLFGPSGAMVERLITLAMEHRSE
jgi:hypothetical protein